MNIDSTTATTNTKPDSLGQFSSIIGGMSFIPLIGVIFGVISIVWGLGTKKSGGKRLATIGAIGIGFTIILYGSLFYFGIKQRGGIYDEMRAKLAQAAINSSIQTIEFYKIQHGSYPESLNVLLKESPPQNSIVSVIDPTSLNVDGQPRFFFYERVGDDHYYLRGLGLDGQPFTPDDIIPQVVSFPNSKAGLLLERKPNS